MKYIFLTLLISLEASAATANFNSLICRSYDYYQLGGNRKVVEMAINKTRDGHYRATTSHSYEILLADGSFQERERTLDGEASVLTCLQGAATDDPRVVTCATPGVQQYINLNRLDRTNVMSAFSSRPGAVIKSVTFESETLGFGSPSGEQHFMDKDCVLN